MPELIKRGAPRTVINSTDGTPNRPPINAPQTALYCITEYIENVGYVPNDNGAAAIASILSIYEVNLGIPGSVGVDFKAEGRNYEITPSVFTGFRQWESTLTAEQAQAITDNFLTYSGGNSITVEAVSCPTLELTPEQPQAIGFIFDFDATNYVWRFTYSIDKNFLVGEPAACKKNIALYLDDSQNIKINIANNLITNDGGTPGWFLSNSFAAGDNDGVVYLYIPIAVFNANAPTVTSFDYDVKVKDPNDIFSSALTGTINI